MTVNEWLNIIRDMPDSVVLNYECYRYAKNMAGLTDKKVADMAGVSLGTIGNIKRGKKIGKHLLPYICESLNVTVDFLLGEFVAIGYKRIDL